MTLKSGLEVTQCHWKWCHSEACVRFPIPLLYSNYDRICSRLWYIYSVKEWPDLENRVKVRSRSLEMAPIIDRSHTSLNTISYLHTRSGHL